VSMTNKKK